MDDVYKHVIVHAEVCTVNLQIQQKRKTVRTEHAQYTNSVRFQGLHMLTIFHFAEFASSLQTVAFGTSPSRVSLLVVLVGVP